MEKVMNILNINDAYDYLEEILPNTKIIIVTGVTGQDGSYMVEYLLKYTDAMIFGGARRLSVSNHENIKHLENEPRFKLINFDLTDSHSINRTISTLRPDYFINFAAQSFVASSWDFPEQTWHSNCTGVLHILEAVRQYAPSCRVYNAGSSEEFGDVQYSPQDEKHPLRPRSPYGASKAAARQLIKVYRESYNIYAVQGWLFNHESKRRGEEFVTRKITKGVARIAKKLEKGSYDFEPIELGNLEAIRDWSHSDDFMDAVWLMLNQDHFSSRYQEDGIQDYVVASGTTHSVRDFVESAFAAAGISGCWTIDKSKTPLSEKYVLSGEMPINLVTINEKFYRPAEVSKLLGNPAKVKEELAWKPNISFDQLVKEMVEHDMKLLDNK